MHVNQFVRLLMMIKLRSYALYAIVYRAITSYFATWIIPSAHYSPQHACVATRVLTAQNASREGASCTFILPNPVPYMAPSDPMDLVYISGCEKTMSFVQVHVHPQKSVCLITYNASSCKKTTIVSYMLSPATPC